MNGEAQPSLAERYPTLYAALVAGARLLDAQLVERAGVWELRGPAGVIASGTLAAVAEEVVELTDAAPLPRLRPRTGPRGPYRPRIPH